MIDASRPGFAESMSLFSELKRRNVFRAAVAYIAISWLLIQVTETLFPLFGLSDAAIRSVVIALAIGFVPAVIAAWAFELTPDGLIRDGDVDRSSPSVKALGKRLDRLIIVFLALAVGYFAIDKFLLDPARDRAREQEIAEVAKEEGRAEATREARDGSPMVAVLPFSAVGSGDDSAFFAAGVHDDLLTQLAQLQSIRVISRTSVMEYKDVVRNIREIGQALGADAILEGGVQRAGDRIRINAQLIDANTDEHLWAETYDRDLTPSSIFDVQSEIALAIATAMHGTLSTPTETRVSPIPTNNMAAYRAYHEALVFEYSAHGNSTTEEYRDLLRRAAELDPSYTRPLAELVGSLTLSAFGRDQPDLVEQAEEAIRKIEAVGPGSADHLIAQAYYTYYIVNDYELAHKIASIALEITPSDERLVSMRSWIERRQGNWDAMIESIRLARTLDPRDPRWTSSLITNLWFAHRYDEAVAEIEASRAPDYWSQILGATIKLREHRDFAIVEAETEAIVEEFGDNADVTDLLWARAMNRNYSGAEALLDLIPEPVEGDRMHYFGFPDKWESEILVYWLLEDRDKLDDVVADAQEAIADYVASGSRTTTGGRIMIGAALLAAAQGDRAEAVNLVRRWNREGALDWPERVGLRDMSCSILGMAGAADDAVDCLRTGLEEPSLVMYFRDPYLPFFDSIRDDPVFVELLAELEAAVGGT